MKTMNKTVYKNVGDVGIFENFLKPHECNHLIELFKVLQGMKLTMDRKSMEGTSSGLVKKDESAFVTDEEVLQVVHVKNYQASMRDLIDRFWNAYNIYSDEYGGFIDPNYPHYIYGMKLQKTKKAEGYHVWHDEASQRGNSHRITAFTVYLNTVKSGGETEYLRQSLRLPATAGTLAIWPANFTHVHRGNPPLEGEKYILTGWTEF